MTLALYMPLSQHLHAPETNVTCRSQDLQGNLDTDEMDNSEGVQAFSPEARLGDTDRSPPSSEGA